MFRVRTTSAFPVIKAILIRRGLLSPRFRSDLVRDLFCGTKESLSSPPDDRPSLITPVVVVQFCCCPAERKGPMFFSTSRERDTPAAAMEAKDNEK